MEGLNNLNQDKLIEMAQVYGGKVVGFIIIIVATFIIAGWVNSLIVRSSKKTKLDESLSKFFAKLAKYAVIALGVVTALGVFGVQTASFAAVIASAGFAIGMALQGTLGHFASGVMILLFKPFKVGQNITVGGASGTVAEIDIFSTMLDTPDNRRIIIPNGSVFGSLIENISHHPTRRVEVVVGTDYSSDIDRTRSILNAAVKDCRFGLAQPEPVVLLLELADSSVNWAVRVWVQSDNFWQAKDDLTARIKNQLDDAGIGIPFPQMELNLPKEYFSLDKSREQKTSLETQQ
ncbi:MAG: mechanosensitive ion channel [Bdellovibrionales bacterium]